MEHKYGNFSSEQMDEYKAKLHKKLFWLILYKDPKLNRKYKNVDFKKYFTHLMGEIDGLNQLLSYPSEIVEIMSILQEAYSITEQDAFNYKEYRKYVLDAHALVDEIGVDAR